MNESIIELNAENFETEVLQSDTPVLVDFWAECPVWYGDEGGEVFLGRDFQTRRGYSEAKARAIDEELTRILREQYDEAMCLLHDQRATLDRIADALLERETLDSAELALRTQDQRFHSGLTSSGSARRRRCPSAGRICPNRPPRATLRSFA